jgi:hypothetical protein
MKCLETSKKGQILTKGTNTSIHHGIKGSLQIDSLNDDNILSLTHFTF